MNIAFLPSADLSYESGSIINALITIKGLKELGVTVATLAQKLPIDINTPIDNISTNPKLLEHPIITDRYITDEQHIENLEIYLAYLFTKHVESKIDVVVVQYFSVASYAAKVFGEVMGVPYIVFSFGRDLSSFDQLSSNLKRMIRESITRVSGIIFPNEEILNSFKILRVNKTPPYLISPPALTADIYDLDCSTTQRLPKDMKVITTINSCFKEEKGIDSIIMAFSSMRKQHNDVILVIAGTDDHPESVNYKRLKALAKRFEISDSIFFPGYLNRAQIGGLLAGTDLFIDARYVSNFSSVLIEAQAFKVPTISAKNLSSLQVIEHGANGLLFDANDSYHLAELGLSVLKNPTLAKVLTNGCTEWCNLHLSTFESNNTIKDIYNFIKGVVKHGS
ncbi:glycosyltransferase [Pseudomonas sp. FEN]|uniref:glycosyltransferase n=1 Tax=Pseudomonas sp. FEN TaxID=2767468 RepID=UPI00174E6335|nr:glycosyltransferase [Pseudomonas sp. FEN]CAD5197878.1 hypothetical protein [Pseudomonas sp. FEN]